MRSVDLSRYFGTYYSQVGVFLKVSRDMRRCHFARSHIIGLPPPDVWQANPSAYAKIAFGHFTMLVRAAARAPWVTQDLLRAFFATAETPPGLCIHAAAASPPSDRFRDSARGHRGGAAFQRDYPPCGDGATCSKDIQFADAHG